MKDQSLQTPAGMTGRVIGNWVFCWNPCFKDATVHSFPCWTQRSTYVNHSN
jgi:hypothetical protein